MAKATVEKLRNDAVTIGRDPHELKILTMVTPVVGKTEEEASEKYNDYKKYISYEGALALFGGWTGVDLAGLDPDSTLEYIENNAIRSALENYTKIEPNRKWTVREIAESIGIGGMGSAMVGSPEQIADEMEKWIDEAGVDGFNLAYAISPGTFKDFADYVVPVLQERGRVPKTYEGTSLRDNLFGKGDQLPLHHAGKQYRVKQLVMQKDL